MGQKWEWTDIVGGEHALGDVVTEWIGKWMVDWFSTGWRHNSLDGGHVKSMIQRMEGQSGVVPSGTVPLELAGHTSSRWEQTSQNTPWCQTQPAMMRTKRPPAADPAAPPGDNPNEPPLCTRDAPPPPPGRPPMRSAADGARRIPPPPPPPPPVAHEVGSFAAPSSISSCTWAPPPPRTSPTSAMGDASSLVEGVEWRATKPYTKDADGALWPVEKTLTAAEHGHVPP